MGAAHNALAWAACIVSIGLPVGIIMAIKLQEDRETEHKVGSVVIDDELYLRRYRFLLGSLPMAFFLLMIVAVPMFACRSSVRCTERSSVLLLLISLVVGLLAWSLMTSLIYNRYFHSPAKRPFRYVRGAERRMLFASRGLAVVAAVTMVVGLI